MNRPDIQNLMMNDKIILNIQYFYQSSDKTCFISHKKEKHPFCFVLESQLNGQVLTKPHVRADFPLKSQCIETQIQTNGILSKNWKLENEFHNAPRMRFTGSTKF